MAESGIYTSLPSEALEMVEELVRCGLYGNTVEGVARQLILDELKRPIVRELIAKIPDKSPEPGAAQDFVPVSPPPPLLIQPLVACEVCRKMTVLRCSDCAACGVGNVAICSNPECKKKHDATTDHIPF
jgi:hypothetical protein